MSCLSIRRIGAKEQKCLSKTPFILHNPIGIVRYHLKLKDSKRRLVIIRVGSICDR